MTSDPRVQYGEASTQRRDESPTQDNMHSVYLVSSPGYESPRPPIRVAMISEEENTWIIRTLGGVLCQKHESGQVYKFFGLGACFENSEMAPLSSLERTLPHIQADKPIGKLRRSSDNNTSLVEIVVPKNADRDWSRGEAEDFYVGPNMIEVPAGFGEKVTVARIARHMTFGEIWITTGRGVVVGVGVASRRAGVVIGEESRDTPDLGAEHWSAFTTETTLSQEDCGSWAIDAKNSELLGVVVEVSRNRVWIYPAMRINALEELHLQLPGYRQRDLEEVGRESTSEHVEMPSNIQTKPGGLLSEVISTFCSCFNLNPTHISRSDVEKAGGGNAFAEVNGQEVYELPPGKERDWQVIEYEINRLISRTPSRSRKTPIIALYGVMANSSPTVVIRCNSKPYSIQLKQALKRSKILDKKGFVMMIADTPVDTSLSEGRKASQQRAMEVSASHSHPPETAQVSRAARDTRLLGTGIPRDRPPSRHEDNEDRPDGYIGPDGYLGERPIWNLTQEDAELWEKTQPRINNLLNERLAQREKHSIALNCVRLHPLEPPLVIISSDSQELATQARRIIQESNVLRDMPFDVIVSTEPLVFM